MHVKCSNQLSQGYSPFLLGRAVIFGYKEGDDFQNESQLTSRGGECRYDSELDTVRNTNDFVGMASPSKVGLLGERDVPIQQEILLILAALFRLVAGITCCVAVFIVR